jgi:hypothetical protein
MKTLLAMTLLFAGMSNIYAQSINSYGSGNFTYSNGTFTPVSGGTLVNVLLTDDATSTAIDMGFDFYFMGTRYRNVYAGSNGYLSFNPAATNVDPNDQLLNDLENCNPDLRPLIAPLWDDIDGNATDATSSAKYITTGSAPFRVFTFEWLNFEWDWTSNNAEISFQVKLYESTGKIEFVYNRVGTDPITSPSASIGIAAAGPGEFVSLNNVTTPTPSTLTETDILAVKPATGKTFAFEPPAPDADPSALIFSNVFPTAMQMDWTDNSSNETGFVIYSSTDGVNFAYLDIVGADVTSYFALNLQTSTTYTFKIYGITEGGVSLDATGSQITGPASLKVPITSPAVWSDDNAWSPFGAPGPEDSVVIDGGNEMVLDGFAFCYSLRIGGGTGTATLMFDESNIAQLIVTTNVVIESNGIFQTSPTGTQTGHSLIVSSGNLINNGILDFSTNSQLTGASITFESATEDQYFTCDPSSTTNLKQAGGVIVSKGSDITHKVVFTPGGDITVEGANTAGFLQLLNGGFEIAGSEAFNNPLFDAAGYTIESTTALYLDNPNATIDGQNSDILLNGKIKVLQGTFNAGNTADNVISASSNLSFLEITGGTVNIAGRLNFTDFSTYIQSGGTLVAPTEGNSSSGNATINSSSVGSTFEVTGGVINLVNSSTGGTQIDLNIAPEFLTYTGATLKLGNGSTTGGSNFNLQGNIPSLTYQSGVALSATLLGDMTISNNLDLPSTNSTIILNGNALVLSGGLTGSGSFTGSSASDLTVTGGGSMASLKFTSGDELLNSLTINRISSGSITLGTDLALAGTLAFIEGRLNIGSNELSLNGNVTGSSSSNTLSLDGSSDLSIGGAGTIGNLFFDQATPGTTNRLHDFSYNRSAITVTLGNALQVAGNITPTSGTLATGGNLTLVSDGSGTANLLSGSGSYISGNVTVQRFVPSTARRFRFLAPNITNGTLQDWKNEIYITGPGTGNTIGQDNSNGFDATTSNQAGIYYYNETNSQPSIDSGWVVITNNTSSLTNVALTPGQGYRVFVRGDRSNTGRLDGTIATQNPVTLDLAGPVNTGNVAMPVSFTSSGTATADGWCLLGNPYPSAYDWNALHDAGRTGSSPDFSGTNYAHFSPVIYIYDAISNGYLSYNASSNAGTLTNGIIPSGAAFFVQTTDVTPSLTFVETHKTSAAAVSLFKTSEPGFDFTIKLIGDSINSDRMIIKYLDEATPFVDGYDIPKLFGPDVNIAGKTPDNGTLSLTCKPEPAKGADTTFLYVGVKRTGRYSMEFENEEFFAGEKPLVLIDLFTGQTINLRKEYTYEFSCDYSNSKTYGNGRFMIVTGEPVTTGEEEKNALTTGQYLYLFPVNTTDHTSVYSRKSISGNTSVTIADVSGKIVGSFSAKQWANNRLDIDMTTYNQGMYFISIQNKETGKIDLLRCIKQ